MHAISVSGTCSLRLGVRGSWDTQHRLPYNPNAPRKQLNKKLQTPTQTQSPPLISTRKEQYISDLLKRTTAPTPAPAPAPVPTIEEDDSYLGYERWLPTPPKVVKPRSVFNAATLAYIGDCIYEVSFYITYVHSTGLSSLYYKFNSIL